MTIIFIISKKWIILYYFWGAFEFLKSFSSYRRSSSSSAQSQIVSWNIVLFYILSQEAPSHKNPSTSLFFPIIIINIISMYCVSPSFYCYYDWIKLNCMMSHSVIRIAFNSDAAFVHRLESINNTRKHTLKNAIEWKQRKKEKLFLPIIDLSFVLYFKFLSLKIYYFNLHFFIIFSVLKPFLSLFFTKFDKKYYINNLTKEMCRFLKGK